jgi:pyrroloquinoline quinone biosynthesis protein B
MKTLLHILVFIIAISCNEVVSEKVSQPNQGNTKDQVLTETSLVILGTVQDAGSPHIGCENDCCKELFTNPDPFRKVVSLGIIDPENNKTFLFEATPDMTTQLKKLKQIANSDNEFPDGIFLTHAHIGHYSGLMYLGKEASNANKIPVYAMPRMRAYLTDNGPWSQLVTNDNISFQSIENYKEIQLTPNLRVIPFTVPHRDEFSETVGFKIIGPNKSLLFIPDIDKWEKWETNILEAISEVDYAFVDATFFDGEEINHRDISEIPHPFIVESLDRFKDLPLEEKQKIHFIHFNHTNPVLDKGSEAFWKVVDHGFNIAQINSILKL